MTDTQLYLATGVPVVLNAAMLTLAVTLIMNHMNSRFDAMLDLWRAELQRVEEVLDARLKHLEER
ncbi:MAG: hypothetical protein ABSF64_05145 [Bryobacteraceae bacterium]|jgi:hypothetical protein